MGATKRKRPRAGARRGNASMQTGARERRTPPELDKALRQHLVNLLRIEGAHASFDQAVAGLPVELSGVKPAGTPFTAWRLLEHLRIAQWDILEFSRNPRHVSPAWPEGYWPATDAPPDAASWEKSVSAFRADLKAMEKLVAEPTTDLFAKIPHGQGQTVLREALLVADHNSYHVGQLVMLRRLLGAWPAA